MWMCKGSSWGATPLCLSKWNGQRSPDTPSLFTCELRGDTRALSAKSRKCTPTHSPPEKSCASTKRELATIHGERERKAFIEKAEDEMTEQFEGDLRNMTVSEGILLIKLIDRETGETSYALIQELKGKFSAFMWQSVARLFGHNLKNEFDAEGDDAIINDIVERIESGEIKVVERQVDLAVSE